MGFIDLALVCSELFPGPLSPEAQELMGKMELGLKRAMRQVGVQSAPGQGATFWFTLPIEVAPQ